MTITSPVEPAAIEERKARARAWFEQLRDDICASFEQLEDEAPQDLYMGSPGRFIRTPWERTDHGGAPKPWSRTRTNAVHRTTCHAPALEVIRIWRMDGVSLLV